MKRQCIAGLVICIGFAAGVLPVCAAEESRISGEIGLGFVIIESGNNLVPGSSSATISNLDSSAETETSFAPLLIPRLAYDIGSLEGAVLFFKTDPPIDEIGSLGINFGVTDTLKGLGILEVGGYFSPFSELYENPYLTGVKRETTSVMDYGGKIAFNRILDSGLRVNFAWMNRDVDEDELAKLQPKMARDGNIYSLNANYSFFPSKNFEIRPRFGVRKANLKGEANSYTKIKYGVEMSCTLSQLTLASEIYLSSSEYDERSPIFSKTRDNEGYGINLVLHYAAPLGYERWSAAALIGYSRDDSNINFYDTEALTIGVLLSYAFAY